MLWHEEGLRDGRIHRLRGSRPQDEAAHAGRRLATMLILGAFASAMPLVSQTLVVDGDIDTGGVFRQGGSPMLVTGTIGGTNIGVGFEAGQSRTTGDFNTALGTRSLRTNTVGSLNTVVGYRVLYNNTGGHDNVSVGQDSLFFNDMLSSRGGWDPDGVWHPVPYVDEKAA